MVSELARVLALHQRVYAMNKQAELPTANTASLGVGQAARPHRSALHGRMQCVDAPINFCGVGGRCKLFGAAALPHVPDHGLQAPLDYAQQAQFIISVSSQASALSLVSHVSVSPLPHASA
jgi:hypothetical protein